MAELLREYLIKLGWQVDDPSARIRAATQVAVQQVGQLSQAQVKAYQQQIQLVNSMLKLAGVQISTQNKAHQQGVAGFNAHTAAAHRFGQTLNQHALAPLTAIYRQLSLLAATYFSIRGLTNTIKDLSELDSKVRMLRTSITGLRALEQSFVDIGGKAADATEIVSTLREAMIDPGNANLLRRWGVTATDMAGKASQLATKFASMTETMAVEWGKELGIGSELTRRMRDSAPALADSYRKNIAFIQSFGVNQERAAKGAANLTSEWSRFGLAMTQLRDAFFSSSFGQGGGFFGKLNEWLAKGGGRDMAKFAEELGEHLGRFLGGQSDQFIKWLERLSDAKSPDRQEFVAWFTAVRDGAESLTAVLRGLITAINALRSVKRGTDTVFDAIADAGRATRRAAGEELETDIPRDAPDRAARVAAAKARRERYQGPIDWSGESPAGFLWRKLRGLGGGGKTGSLSGGSGTNELAGGAADDRLLQLADTAAYSSLKPGQDSPLKEIEANTQETVTELKRATTIWEKFGNAMPAWAQEAMGLGGGGGGGGTPGGGGGGGTSGGGGASYPGGGGTPGGGAGGDTPTSAPGASTPGGGGPGSGAPGAPTTPTAPAGPGSSVPGGGAPAAPSAAPSAAPAAGGAPISSETGRPIAPNDPRLRTPEFDRVHRPGGAPAPAPAAPAGAAAGGDVTSSLANIPMTAQERNYLGLILQHESLGGRNVLNYMGRRQGIALDKKFGYTAQGYYQMLNTNWRRLAPGLGIKTPNAMASSFEDQTRVALALLREKDKRGNVRGIGHWAGYNSPLRRALMRGDVAKRGLFPIDGAGRIIAPKERPLIGGMDPGGPEASIPSTPAGAEPSGDWRDRKFPEPPTLRGETPRSTNVIEQRENWWTRWLKSKFTSGPHGGGESHEEDHGPGEHLVQKKPLFPGPPTLRGETPRSSDTIGHREIPPWAKGMAKTMPALSQALIPGGGMVEAAEAYEKGNYGEAAALAALEATGPAGKLLKLGGRVGHAAHNVEKAARARAAWNVANAATDAPGYGLGSKPAHAPENVVDDDLGELGRRKRARDFSQKTWAGDDAFKRRGVEGAPYTLGGDVSNDNRRKMSITNNLNATIHTNGDAKQAASQFTRTADRELDLMGKMV